MFAKQLITGIHPKAWWNHFPNKNLNLDTSFELCYLPLSFGSYQSHPNEFIDTLNTVLDKLENTKVILELFKYVRIVDGELSIEKLLAGFTWTYEWGFYRAYLRDVANALLKRKNILYINISDCFDIDDSHEFAKDIDIYQTAIFREMFYYLRDTGISIPLGFSDIKNDKLQKICHMYIKENQLFEADKPICKIET